jgi:hypothetical protein
VVDVDDGGDVGGAMEVVDARVLFVVCGGLDVHATAAIAKRTRHTPIR